MRLRNAGPGALFLSFLFSFFVPVRHRVIHSVCKKRAPPQKSPGSTLVLCRVKLTHQFGRWPTGRHSAARRRSRVKLFFVCICIKLLALPYLYTYNSWMIRHSQTKEACRFGRPSPLEADTWGHCLFWVVGSSGLGLIAPHLSHLERKISTPAFYCQDGP